MKNSMSLTGESSDHKLAAIFASEPAAREAAVKIIDVLGLDDAQTEVVKPGGQDAGKKLEPESRGIWHTLIRAHLWLGLTGAAIGAVAYAVMFFAGVGFVTNNPAQAAMIIFYCFLVGLLLGGLVTVRPDHARYIRQSKEALDDGKILLAVHARSLKELRRAKSELEKTGADTIATF